MCYTRSFDSYFFLGSLRISIFTLLEEIFIECISKEDLVMVKTEVDIKVIKTDKKWKIESSDELSNALLGGLVKAAEELSNSFNDIE